jgi:hypothetical protein
MLCIVYSTKFQIALFARLHYNGHEPFSVKHVTGCSQSVGSEIYTTHGIPSASLTARFKTTRTFGLLSLSLSLSLFVTKCKPQRMMFTEKSRNSISVLCKTWDDENYVCQRTFNLGLQHKLLRYFCRYSALARARHPKRRGSISGQKEDRFISLLKTPTLALRSTELTFNTVS